MAIDRNSRKRIRRFAIALIVLVPALYFCALRHAVFPVLRRARHQPPFQDHAEMAEKYFLGNGIPTWLLSPINLLADMLSARNLGTYRLEDLPEQHRAEIEACVKAFIDNGGLIKARVAAVLGDKNAAC